MKRRALTAAALAVAALAAVASLAGAGSAAVQRSEALNCKSTLSVAMLGPFTGDASFIGNEQLTWGKYGVKTIAKELGLKIKLLPQDTQLNPSIAATVAQKVVGNANIVGVLGPAGSQEVQATSATFGGANLAHITGSATRTALTKGPEPQATRAFFRIIPDDSIQGPERRGLHDREAEGQEGRHHRRSGVVLDRPGRGSRWLPEAQGRHGDQRVGTAIPDRLLVVRDEDAERH